MTGAFHRLPHFSDSPHHDWMEKTRLPRFKRASAVVPMQITERDRTIIRHIHRHRFLRSHHLIALTGGSRQAILRRLNLLYHHGYLERPRAQLRYYDQGDSRSIAYGMGSQGGELLKQAFGILVAAHAWDEKNHAIGRVFLEHTLFVADVMVSLELACQNHGGIRVLYHDELELPVKKQPFHWRVTVEGGTHLGVIPDRIFALEYLSHTGESQRSYFFLEADRGTMPVMRKNLVQTSFYRKLLAYEATWTRKVHQRYLGIPHFRVLTVTTSPARVTSLVHACSQLKRGHGLFLFADRSVLDQDLFSAVWINGKTGALSPLLDRPILAGSPVSPV